MELPSSAPGVQEGWGHHLLLFGHPAMDAQSPLNWSLLCMLDSCHYKKLKIDKTLLIFIMIINFWIAERSKGPATGSEVRQSYSRPPAPRGSEPSAGTLKAAREPRVAVPREAGQGRSA